jgi:hypothetical protein
MAEENNVVQLPTKQMHMGVSDADVVNIGMAHHTDGWRVWIYVDGVRRIDITQIRQLDVVGDVPGFMCR